MRLHRFAVLTAAVTYVLLIAGGLVHATGSSLACPDWPLCHGTLMPAMVDGVEYEHSHRLIAGLVATMTIVLGGWIFAAKRRDLYALGVAAPVMVLAQAVLGGLTVLFKLPKWITLSHLTLSMCFFSVLLIIAVRTRPSLSGAPPAPRASTRKLLAVTGVLVLAQMTLGGLVRHSMAGLACITFPLCFGSAWPADSSAERIHMAHRYGAVLVTIAVLAAAWRVWREAAPGTGLRRLAVAAPLLVVVQATLGVLSVTSLLHRPTVVAHLGVGALLIGCTVTSWALAALAVPGASVGAANASLAARGKPGRSEQDGDAPHGAAGASA
jgi:heme A synthase